MNEISTADFLAEGAPKLRKGEMSTSDFLNEGGPDVIDRGARNLQTLKGQAIELGKSVTGNFAKQGRTVLDLQTQLADMILGLPGDAAAKLLNMGTRFAASGTPGVDQKLVGQAGEAAEEMVPEWLKAPIASIRKALGSESKEVIPISEIVAKGASKVEKASGGRITEEDAKFMLGGLLDVAGLAGLRAGAGRLKKNKPAGRPNEVPLLEFVAEPSPAVPRRSPTLPRQALERPAIEGEFTRVPDQGTPGVPQRGAADPKLLAMIAAAGGPALYLAAHPEDKDLLSGLGLLVSGAMKPKGGMWHPEAVERLSTPIKERLLDENGEAYHSTMNNVDRMITNYLNKHAGTATDPLRDVEIPFGEGTKRWEEMTDRAFKEGKGKYLPELGDKVKPDESVWGTANTGSYGGETASINALTSYLSHVGDYLRANVPPEKLGQYDLVRAVKETQKWDAELAKNMEKARLAEKDVSPIYREYPDGMYWQQLTKPGQFARESDVMGHSVRGYEPSRGAPEGSNLRVGEGRNPDWIPEAGEGGHPSYGLGGWEAIKRGDAKIYSLRDKEGRSHVTIEVAAGVKPEDFGGQMPFPHGESPKILQIKGKQNRAPDSKYLPYIQDFVKGEKWGEVGDLGNTGLVDLGATGEGFDRLAQQKMPEAQRFFGNRYITQDSWNEFLKGNRTPNLRQRGEIDPRLLTGLGLTAGGALAGAWLGDDIKSAVYGAIAGGILGTAGGRKGVQAAAHTADHFLGLISTRLMNISPVLHQRALNFELKLGQKTAQAYDKATPFFEALGKLPKATQDAIARGLLNGDLTEVVKVPELRKAYGEVQGVLKDLEKQLHSLGRFGEGVGNYFPRVVKDFEGLKEALGQKVRTGLERVLAEAEGKSARENGRPLTDVEKSIIINRYIHAPAQQSHLPGYAKGRRIGEVTPELQKFYLDPKESYMRYISGAIGDIEIAKFFGKDLVKSEVGGRHYNNVNASIGELVRRESQAGRLTDEQVKEVTSILEARFTKGEEAPSKFVQDVRNVTNAALLGNFWATATQLGDSIASVVHNGWVPTLKALGQKLTGNSFIEPKDLGIVHHVAEELANQRWTAKLTQGIFRRTAFRAIDMFAKGLNLNAAMNKLQAQARRTPQKIAEKYGRAFGEDLPQLIEDLKARRRSELTDSVLFAELSEIQPISKFEMSEFYLRHPNGRLAYQMQTYMLKQADIVRRQAYNQIKNGLTESKPKVALNGFTKLAALGTLFALYNIPADQIKAWMSGYDLDLNADYFKDSLLRAVGLNRYATDQITKGKLKDVIVDKVTPPAIRVFEDIGKAGERAARYIPFIGPGIVDRGLGGNERREIREAKDADAKRKEELGVPRGKALPPSERTPLSDEAKEYRKRQREERLGRGVSDEGQGQSAIKKMAGIEARESFRDAERMELMKKAYAAMGRQGVLDFLAAEEQAQIRRARAPKRRELM